MATYKVKAKMTQYLETTIEADSEDEAWEIARETDGGDFSEIEDAGTWTVESVELEQ